VLNRASDSCPPLRRELPTGNELEILLADSVMDFVNDPRIVRVDHDGKHILLSTIFKWYRSDFLNDLRRRGLAAERDLVDYIANEASSALRNDLAGASEYEIVLEDYDWGINSQEY
jgi:hypothetical protein